MEILAEILWFFVQLVLEVLGEALLEVGLALFQETLGRKNRDPVSATVGYLLLGALVGGASLFAWPHRIFSSGPVPGLSLPVSAVAGAVAMELWGRVRRARGHATTNLATFYGGGAFALAFAAVRFAWAR